MPGSVHSVGAGIHLLAERQGDGPQQPDIRSVGVAGEQLVANPDGLRRQLLHIHDEVGAPVAHVISLVPPRQVIQVVVEVGHGLRSDDGIRRMTSPCVRGDTRTTAELDVAVLVLVELTCETQRVFRAPRCRTVERAEIRHLGGIARTDDPGLPVPAEASDVGRDAFPCVLVRHGHRDDAGHLAAQHVVRVGTASTGAERVELGEDVPVGHPREVRCPQRPQALRCSAMALSAGQKCAGTDSRAVDDRDALLSRRQPRDRLDQ